LEPQRALADFLSEGHFARHVRRLLRAYGERRRILLTSLARRLGDAVDVLPSVAGLHVSVFSRDPDADVDAWVARARERGVAVQPLRPYYQGRARAGLALGYGLIAPPAIDDGVARLAATLAPAPRFAAGRRAR